MFTSGISQCKKRRIPGDIPKAIFISRGSLDKSISDQSVLQLFELVRSEYHRSKVMEDGYEQAGDESDTKGGYWISLLRALD